MQDKIKAIADSKIAWLGLGSFVGSLWGADAANAVSAVGAFVMAIL